MIASCVVAHISPSMERFARVDWSTFSDEFYENTEHMQATIAYVNELVPHIAPRINTAYQTYFYNQLAQALFARFTQAVFSCRKISADGVQQMIVDAKGLQSMLEHVPLLGFKKAATGAGDMLLDDLALNKSAAAHHVRTRVYCILSLRLFFFLIVYPVPFACCRLVSSPTVRARRPPRTSSMCVPRVASSSARSR